MLLHLRLIVEMGRECSVGSFITAAAAEASNLSICTNSSILSLILNKSRKLHWRFRFDSKRLWRLLEWLDISTSDSWDREARTVSKMDPDLIHIL